MKRKIVLFIVLISLALGVIVCVYDVSSQNDIEGVVEKALRVQYGWAKFSCLKEISTEKFVKTVDRDIIYVGRRFYSVEKDYMEHLEKISDDNVEVIVYVYSPDILIHKFTLKQTEDGGYLIDNIELDI